MKKCYNCGHLKHTKENLFGATLEHTECSELVKGVFYTDGNTIQVAAKSVRVGLNFGCTNWIEKEAEYVGFSESESEEAQQKVS